MKERFSNTGYTHRGQRLPARWEHYALGQMALIEGRGAEALDHFEEALRHAPLIWTLDLLEDCLGKAYLELGMFDEALAEYERILGINPNYPLASYHLIEAPLCLCVCSEKRSPWNEHLYLTAVTGSGYAEELGSY